MRCWAMLLCMAAAVLASHPAYATTSVEVLGTWPAGETVTLGRDQTFYVHLRYRSDQPTHIWALPYGDNGSLRVGSNPSRTYPAGDGEALVWFFFLKPGQRITGVSILAGDGTTRRTSKVADFPVDITGSDEPGAAQPAPEWVMRLNGEDKAARDAAYQRAMDEPDSASDLAITVLLWVMMLIGVLGLLAPTWGLWRWRGGWRVAAILPAAIMVFVVLRIFFDTARDPTSHNLWPFEILMWGGFSCAWMLLAALVRKLTGIQRA